MKLATKKPKIFAETSLYLSTVVRVLLKLLAVIVVIALAAGVYKTGVDLVHFVGKPLEQFLQQILVDIVFILALTEITIMLVAYLQEGRVHVRYIVDMVLIIMLIEVVSAWFTKPKFEYFASLALIITVLGALRLSVTRLAPNDPAPKS